MIHIYKAGGLYKKDGKEYSVKAINSSDKPKYLSDGWVLTLDDVKKPKAKSKAKVKTDDNKE